MDIALLLSTFFTVFLAELGDKTQLATVAISGTSNRPLAVFIGSSSALVIASLIGALAGGSMANVVPGEMRGQSTNMPQKTCRRCGFERPADDPGTGFFCAKCGGPM